MCSAKDRIKTYLKVSIEEIDLIEKMSASPERNCREDSGGFRCGKTG